MLKFGNKEFRNLEEQVGYLTAAFNSGKLIDELGIKVLGVFPDLATAKATIGPPYEYGDAFEIGGTKPYNLYIYTRDIEDFFDFGPFPAPGPQGKLGPTPNISIKASVTNTTGIPEAIVTKTGTDEAPIFNFTFKNIKGDRGQTGQQGIKGKDGKDAVVSQIVLTIDPSDWNNKTVTKSVAVTSSNNVIVGPTPDSYDLYGLCGIRCTQQVTGGIVLTCITVPTQVIYVNVLVLNRGD